MADDRKQLPLQARLRNDSKETQIYYWDGVPYIWKPGEEIPNVPIDVAGHFIGRHKCNLQITPPLENDAKAIRREEERVMEAMPLDKRPDGVPLTLVEIVDPNVEIAATVTEVNSVPAPAPVEQPEEEPFAALKKGK